ncbi:hypothetical protein [Ralstonia phage RP13]|nr:hypothetical protein [Ralstonia phage RP13]
MDVDYFKMLDEIRSTKVVYNIHFCRAGIGIQFFDPPSGFDHVRFIYEPNQVDWKKYLVVYKYYPTLQEAIAGEYRRIVLKEA